MAGGGEKSPATPQQVIEVVLVVLEEGGRNFFKSGNGAVGSGNTPPVSPPQGNDGGLVLQMVL